MKSPSPADASFDVVVLGAGTAGLAAARAAHDEGAKVAVVDHGPLGTFCARLGCMPSKTLLRSTWALARARRLEALGVSLSAPPVFDWEMVRARVRALVADFAGGVARDTRASADFTLLEGDAAFVEEGALRVGSRRVSARGWVIAAGSVPIRPAVEGLDDVAESVLTSDGVYELASIPSSVAVVGSGSVGVELGQFLARAGARVHLVGEDDRVAGLGPGKPREAIVAALARELTLHSASRIAHVSRARTADGRGDVAVALASGETFSVERILLAAGRRPDVAGLGLASMGVRVSGGVPSHDEHLRTTNPAVFVAGDAAGAPGLLHTATLQGRAAGVNAARGERTAGAARARTAAAYRVL